jgi:hypothetical protein
VALEKPPTGRTRLVSGKISQRSFTLSSLDGGGYRILSVKGTLTKVTLLRRGTKGYVIRFLSAAGSIISFADGRNGHVAREMLSISVGNDASERT